MSGQNEEKGRIGVVMGGCSSEREISLKSGRAVFEALKQKNVNVSAVELTTEDEESVIAALRRERIEVAFIALHGKFGEDGTFQQMLEKHGIAYTGSGPEASRRAMDKIVTVQMARKGGVPVPEGIALTQSDGALGSLDVARLGGFPVVVKPSSEGSSIGVSLAADAAQLQKAAEEAWRYGPRILVEQCIRGREMTVGILGSEAMPVIEIKPKMSFFDFEAKYQKGKTDYIVPAEIPSETAQELQRLALQTFRVLGCRDFARVDFMLDASLNPYLLEINTIPGFTSTSLLPKAAAHRGIGFTDLCLRMIEMACGRRGKDTCVGLNAGKNK